MTLRYKRGDTVRLKPFGVEVCIVDHYDGPHYQVRSDDGSEFTIDERIFEQPADDPSKDPVGTVRKGLRGRAAVKIRPDDWRRVLDKDEQALRFHNDEVTDWPVIGAVPGTPAAEAQKPREPWTGDGSEEPPAHVQKVIDADGDELSRVEPDALGRVWRRTKYSSGGPIPKVNVGWTGRIYGPYIEVLPE